MNSCSVDHCLEKRMELVGTCWEDMSMSSCVVSSDAARPKWLLGLIYTSTRHTNPLDIQTHLTWLSCQTRQLTAVTCQSQKWHWHPVNVWERHRQAVYIQIWQWLLVNVNKIDDLSEESSAIKELTIISTKLKHTNNPTIQQSTMTSNNTTPLAHPKNEHKMSPCQHCRCMIIYTPGGWGIHKCLLSAFKNPPTNDPTPSSSKKLLPNTPDIWTPGLPWYSPAKVKELNSKIKEQDTIFEMEKIPQYHMKTEKQKINLYKQVPFVVSIHYSNWS